MATKKVTATLAIVISGEDELVVDIIATLVGDLLHGDLPADINDTICELLEVSDDYDPEYGCGTSYEEHLAITDDNWRSATWIENIKVGDE